jgi:hypothetical protein
MNLPRMQPSETILCGGEPTARVRPAAASSAEHHLFARVAVRDPYAVTGAKVKDGSLTAADFRAGSLP